MVLSGKLTDQVTEAMREAADTIILPRYQHLGTGEVLEKTPGELVTVADRESERFLSDRLRALVPGSFVIGEELAEAEPDVVEKVDDGTVWLVDPLDGTANFVAGKPIFSVMVALMQKGEPVLAWMLNPVTGVLHHAEAGSGAFRDGERLTASKGPNSADGLRGALLNRLMPPDMRALMAERGKIMKECLPGLGCAGLEYPAIVEGQEDFAIFWRSLPWDHVPGSLFLREAGGTAKRLDGRDYRASDRGKGLIVSCSIAVHEMVCEQLIGRGIW